MFKKIAALLFTSLIMTSAYASHPQQISLCLDVSGNTSPYNFVGKFESSDFFDLGNMTSPVTNGLACSQHKYGHGPKNIKFSVSAKFRYRRAFDASIVPDESCRYMVNDGGDTLISSHYQPTSDAAVKWTFEIKPIAPVKAYKYTFGMHCTRSGN